MTIARPWLLLACVPACFSPEKKQNQDTGLVSTTAPAESGSESIDPDSGTTTPTSATATSDPTSASTMSTTTSVDSGSSGSASSSPTTGELCGNGVIDDGEACDDAVEVAAGSCTDCALACDADFDDCNADGEDGCEVSLCGGTCAAPGGAMEFDYSGAIEVWNVPDCAQTLTIEAWGAQGGGGPTVAGGLGARIRGTFTVEGGEALQILVGGIGLDASNDSDQGGGSGGGGSFVVDMTNAPWVVAGGGGGALYSLTGVGDPGNARELDGGPGQAGTAGQAGDAGAAGGVAGGGGDTWYWTGWHAGTGGGGLLGDGTSASSGGFGTANQPGIAFVNGGAGGVGGSLGRSGGFGGGGAAGFTGAGGGGYSGGGSSTYGDAGACGCPGAQTYGGGGGGSFNGGDDQDNAAGANMGDGQIVITWQ